MKIAENHRPSLKEIETRLRKTILPVFFQIFVEDIQNDCDCETEEYEYYNQIECYNQIYTLCTSPNGILRQVDNICKLPMNNNLNNDDIWELLKKACQEASDEMLIDDVMYCKMIYNPKSDFFKIIEIYKKTTKMKLRSENGEFPDLIAVDFVPIDNVYFFPEIEFFGVLTINLAGLGAMCVPKSILKKQLN